ncbi:MAG: hypothetical protein KDA44_21245, partial [Planctomycetales bacterium]|nr:hypothetical protein [Planctomycetales bacterium]
SDIGIIELSGIATIRDAQGAVVPRPLLYDGSGEQGVTNAFVGYGSWGIGSQGSNGGLFPSSGPRRAGGTNVINSLFESGKGIGTRFDAPGSATAGVNESAVASGDSGSAWWQQHDGRWAIIATTNVGSGTTYGTSSTGARVSRYIDWIESVYSDVQRWSVLLGDVNRDGFVRGNGLGDPAVDDFSAFILGWRQPNTAASPNHADLNGDGTADLADFWLLREALQSSGQAPIRAELLGVAVPEPSASWLALSAAATWRRRRPTRSVA